MPYAIEHLGRSGMDIAIRKYGGSSLATDQQVASAAEQVAQAHNRGTSLVVVVSARGKRTDGLVRSAAGLSRFPDSLEMDKLLATGEAESAALFAIALRNLGVPAESLSGARAGLRAVGRHGSGFVSEVDPEPLRRRLAAGRVAVVSGFQALSPEGETITLGRGGSDISAVALAAGHRARTCEICTDVDGVHRADPRVVVGAPLLTRIDAETMSEMAFSGAGVMHARAVELAAAHAIDVVVRNSADRTRQTTIVGRGADVSGTGGIEGRAGVVAVTHDRAVTQVVVKGGSGVAALNTVASMEIPVDSVTWGVGPSDELRMAFCMPDAALEEVLAELTGAVRGANGSVETRRSLGKVSLVGVGLLSRPGTMIGALTALRDREIDAQCVSATQARTTFLVPRARVDEAVVALYEEFLLDLDERGLELMST
ncbi:aspartate kinase [Saccharopolyspora indica]|uniref:aspartate kinase n=1 Tax=Saccharopolyspora indica TaxID=1229659 RepID=UPI0022EB8807|nr:aspartate kinase [Saccharopolyspora indica]MDA3644130.1 aspartate kinase [Saccharopolyspora indica]